MGRAHPSRFMVQLKSIGFYITRPGYAFRALAAKLQRKQVEGPWISPGAIAFCDANLDPSSHQGLEWGSGRSTRWYSERLRSLTSVEHDPAWYDIVKSQLDQSPNKDRVSLRNVPLDHPVDQPSTAHYYVLPRYVALIEEFAENSLDFVVVDGHYRQACVLAALPRIRPGGLLLIDNSDWMPLSEWGVPASWPMVHQSKNFMTQTTIWRKP